MKTIKFVEWIVVHCSASPPDEDIDLAYIRRKHMQQGRADVGYHYFIRRDGTIEKGRPDHIPGAHAPGYNLHSIAICLAGGLKKNTTKSEANFTPAQYLSLQTLLEDLKVSHEDAEILGHRDLPGVTNACPSFDVREWLRRIYVNEEAALHPQDRNESSV